MYESKKFLPTKSMYNRFVQNAALKIVYENNKKQKKKKKLLKNSFMTSVGVELYRRA